MNYSPSDPSFSDTPLPEDNRPSPAANHQPDHRFGIWASIQTIFGVAFILATLFTLWTPANLFSNQMLDRMFQAWQSNVVVLPDSTPVSDQTTSPRIGIVSGHWKNDSGSVCKDGITEEQVNLRIATLVMEGLMAEGYQVDLLAEYDSKLTQYQALALISIHNDSCDYINNQATGFKVAAAVHSSYPEKASRLTACLIDRYQTRTNLEFHYNTITPDMTFYHAFDEIHSDTTAAIIETGFLNLDHEILTKHPDIVAQGIIDGINCYIRNENITSTSPTP